MSADPHQPTLREIMEKLREKGSVPLGILNYNFSADALELSVFREVDPDEVNALFAKIGMKVKFK